MCGKGRGGQMRRRVSKYDNLSGVFLTLLHGDPSLSLTGSMLQVPCQVPSQFLPLHKLVGQEDLWQERVRDPGPPQGPPALMTQPACSRRCGLWICGLRRLTAACLANERTRWPDWPARVGGSECWWWVFHLPLCL